MCHFRGNSKREKKHRQIILRFQRLEGNSADPEEVAHNEPPHLDLPCLQIKLFSISLC